MKNKITIITLGCALLGADLAHAALYSSDVDFGRGVNGTNDVTAAGWEGLYGRTDAPAQNATASTDGGTYRIGLLKGTNTIVTNYLYFQKFNGIDNMDFFAHTNQAAGQSTFTSFAPDDYSAGLTATWTKFGDNYAGFYVSVLVDGTWHASTTSISGALANPVFDFLNSDWVDVLDSTSAPLSLATTTTDSATLFGGKTIDGFGYYVDNLVGINTGGRTLRIDNISIDGVPEPSAALLSLLGAELFLRRKR